MSRMVAILAIIGCACVLASILAPAIFLAWRELRERVSLPPIQFVIVGVLVGGLIQYAATKSIHYDGGIRAGAHANWATNDVVHIEWQRDLSRGVFVPETAAVFIDYRPVGSTNEWGLLAQSTVGAWTWEGSLGPGEVATNYDYNVWAYYIPPEPVLTNGVWIYKTLRDRGEKYPIPLRARIEVNGKAIATPAEKRKDEER